MSAPQPQSRKLIYRDPERAARELKGRREHREKYEAIAQKLGVDVLKAMVTRIETKDNIIFNLRVGRDRHLNRIPLRLWDSWDYGVRDLVRKAGGSQALGQPGGWSQADTVCVLKHVAKFHVAGWAAAEDDDLDWSET